MIEESKDEYLSPEVMTEPYSRFLRDIQKLFAFVSLVFVLAEHVDETTDAIMQLASLTNAKTAHLANELKPRGRAGEVLTYYWQALIQMVFCRGVNSYLTYISELLALIFQMRPETMKSQEQVSVEEVLQYESMDDLISGLAERLVYRLSYKGMKDLAAHLSSRLKFDLFAKDDQYERAVRIIEVRNLLVHNRGVVNRIFLSRVPDLNMRPGETMKLSLDAVDDLTFLVRSASDIDMRAAEKFGLPQPVSREQLNEEAAGLLLEA